MKRVLDYTRTFGTGDDVARAFGRALEAGAGVGEEKPGRHSPAAAAFALDAILVTGPFGDAIPAPLRPALTSIATRSEEHTSELQSRENLVCRLLLEKKNR